MTGMRLTSVCSVESTRAGALGTNSLLDVEAESRQDIRKRAPPLPTDIPVEPRDKPQAWPGTPPFP